MTINNAVLKNCLKLSSKITVYVPATNGIDQAADNTEQVKKTAALQEHVGRVVELCEELKREMGQEAVALEINGEMYFI